MVGGYLERQLADSWGLPKFIALVLAVLASRFHAGTDPGVLK